MKAALVALYRKPPRSLSGGARVRAGFAQIIFVFVRCHIAKVSFRLSKIIPLDWRKKKPPVCRGILYVDFRLNANKFSTKAFPASV